MEIDQENISSRNKEYVKKYPKMLQLLHYKLPPKPSRLKQYPFSYISWFCRASPGEGPLCSMLHWWLSPAGLSCAAEGAPTQPLQGANLSLARLPRRGSESKSKHSSGQSRSWMGFHAVPQKAYGSCGHASLVKTVIRTPRFIRKGQALTSS